MSAALPAVLPSTAPLLAVEGLEVRIDGVPVVRGISFEVAAGEILGVVGASGSGKSMTALSLVRLLPPNARMSGSVRFDGRQLDRLATHEMRAVRGAGIGMVFQEPLTALNPLMRISSQVAETVRLHRPVSRRAAAELARDALHAVGLPVDAASCDKYPHELSGGQRQRVALAMAIVLEPPLLIADEPTTALDAITQAQVLERLRALVRERGMGLILVSHDMAVIGTVTERVLVMQDGVIVEQGPTAALGPTAASGPTAAVGRFEHPYTRALLAAALPRPRRAAVAADPASLGRVGDAVLEVRGVVREYPRPRHSLWRAAPPFRAVDDVSLLIHPGEIVGLIGESGSGKSSLARLILALDRPQRGDVRLGGQSFSTAMQAERRRLRRSIQAVFQDPYGSFDPRWRVERLIAEPFHLLDVAPSAGERRRKVDAALDQVGLSSRDATRHAAEFSGGQRQRLAIARALIIEPRVIVFDEALSALDVLIRAQILSLLLDLSRRLRLAYLFISHDINVVAAIADRVYVMQRGRIVESGATAEVLGAPQDEYTQALLAATPQWGGIWPPR